MGRVSRQSLIWIGLFIATWVLARFGLRWSEVLNIGWIMDYPDTWVIPLKDSVSAIMKWLVEEATFGLFTFTEFTRGISWMIEQPYNLARALLAEGFMDGVGRRATQILPPFSWIAVTAGVVALGHYARDWLLAAIVGAAFLYLAVFGQWESAMVTLASVVIAVPIGVAGGLFLGINAYRHASFDRILKPILDLMQTIPIFA